MCAQFGMEVLIETLWNVKGDREAAVINPELY